MNDGQIRSFLEAARCLNFTEAAARLYMSQSVLSRQISSLEAEMNMQLFLRHKKTVRLTPAGAVLAEGLEAVSEQYRAVLEQAQAANRGMNGTLRVGCLEEQLIRHPFAQVLRQFEGRYPQVKLELSRHSYRGLREGLYDGTLDIAITFDMDVAGREGLERQLVGYLPNFLVIPADHPLADREEAHLIDFRDETFLTIAPEESELVSRLLPDSCRACGFQPNLKVAPTFGTLSLWLEAGLGVFGLNSCHVLSCNPALRFLKVPELPDVAQVLAWATENPNPAIALFCQETIHAISASNDTEPRFTTVKNAGKMT